MGTASFWRVSTGICWIWKAATARQGRGVRRAGFRSGCRRKPRRFNRLIPSEGLLTFRRLYLAKELRGGTAGAPAYGLGFGVGSRAWFSGAWSFGPTFGSNAPTGSLKALGFKRGEVRDMNDGWMALLRVFFSGLISDAAALKNSDGPHQDPDLIGGLGPPPQSRVRLFAIRR